MRRLILRLDTPGLPGAHVLALALLLVLAVASPLAFNACAVRSVPLHPGAFNVFDSQTYDVLKIAQAAIKQARADIDATPSFAPYRPQFNQVSAAYNAAIAAFKVYHGAGAGGSTADLQLKLNDLSARLGTLLSSLGVQL
jgi:hypothetical protein